MKTLNDKITLLRTLQERDDFGSIIQTKRDVGSRWCEVIKSDGFFRDVKGGKKRVQTITILTWLSREIDHTYLIKFNGIEYTVVNAVHDRAKGITILQCEFNN